MTSCKVNGLKNSGFSILARVRIVQEPMNSAKFRVTSQRETNAQANHLQAREKRKTPLVLCV